MTTPPTGGPGSPDSSRHAVTVLGNLSIDHVDDAPPSAGGCPAFVGPALDGHDLGRGDGVPRGRIVTRAAPADLPVFATLLESMTVPCDVLDADSTSSFGLRYTGDDREMTVDSIGPVWTAAHLDEAAIGTEWVHVAPLLRTDFPAETLHLLSTRGHHVSYDGQGLVREPRVGPLRMDRDFDPAVLQRLTVLKLSDEEAAALVPDGFDLLAAARLGVPEILVTHGSGGCDLYVGGDVVHVPPAWKVEGVHFTGTGDMFTTSYTVHRANGDEPVDAARSASLFVAEQLQSRLDAELRRHR